MMKIATACRSCGGTNLTRVLDLGRTALADRLLTEAMLAEEEPVFPLTVWYCSACSLVQIREQVAPEILFGDLYQYFSSFSDALLLHSRDNAERLIEQRRLGPGSLVVELASNDGYMLKNFKAWGIPVLGIDPAPGPAKAAIAAGIDTMMTFFTRDLARQLRSEGRAADVIIANNVLAHVPDLNGFVEGIGILLKEDGVAVIEAPYVKDLIEHCEFDTIYHQHLCYFSISALRHLFARHGLHLNHVMHLPIHGGSLRLFVEKRPAPSPQLQAMLEAEVAAGVVTPEYYLDFAKRVEAIKTDLLNLLKELKANGKRIAAYGAAAKGCTLLNYTGIGPETLDFVVDRNIHKHGRYMPGRHVPIRPVEQLLTEMPDYTLLLAWNFADEIISQQAAYVQRGGRFIVPVPTPRVAEPERMMVA
ncbi:MAG TPA: class I SAM-dependent methyltransferase [Phycisphaerae bacterium]|nr:class I SAM-dependent methyltransferase [Phycisphaerae bacterium]HOB75124.1 class I SAM-dependent methyltransferase [Phycisphaerae bacterium]HOJ54654.1 class I SAM-dependent methyltransferase [Phycisphaerae bacterium]HOL27280.1 class I SAM-dependent methyltransferase [Phycisphaerae bacterium]HPP21081.1 class I SAM-dependent methyltransferase [Phycisphaerae bacterium]